MAMEKEWEINRIHVFFCVVADLDLIISMCIDTIGVKKKCLGSWHFKKVNKNNKMENLLQNMCFLVKMVNRIEPLLLFFAVVDIVVPLLLQNYCRFGEVRCL